MKRTCIKLLIPAYLSLLKSKPHIIVYNPVLFLQMTVTFSCKIIVFTFGLLYIIRPVGETLTSVAPSGCPSNASNQHYSWMTQMGLVLFFYWYKNPFTWFGFTSSTRFFCHQTWAYLILPWNPCGVLASSSSKSPLFQCITSLAPVASPPKVLGFHDTYSLSGTGEARFLCLFSSARGTCLWCYDPHSALYQPAESSVWYCEYKKV